MKTANKVLSRLGLATRAGKLISGEEVVLKAIRSGEAKLVLLAGDASDNTTKKISDKCNSYQVPLLVGFTRFELGSAVGKPERVLFAVTDRGFADMLAKGWGHHSEVENIE
ncbi:YlxQ family RNA-binding protein [Cohnella herbarum]|jgi:ribosomal protein L7Ae-like RNA K-turn-binding protein|uniref:YlxQ family RNA-binding protein n=1 Tax=Cohnella herbarum TaxID=2728023 RepID=A0A7Z2VHV4_9BACL|nr:YlxQ family RNA-binding protein [Cohnella herbarum]QJD83334.1 YlxQ family RNA-binding protein [Cohnella herbarum]